MLSKHMLQILARGVSVCLALQHSPALMHALSLPGGAAGVLRSSEVKLHLHCAPAPGVGMGRMGCSGEGCAFPPPAPPPHLGHTLQVPDTSCPGSPGSLCPAGAMGPRHSPLLSPSCEALAGTLKASSVFYMQWWGWTEVLGSGNSQGWPGSWWSCCRGWSLQAGSACCACAQADQGVEGEEPLCCEPLLFP